MECFDADHSGVELGIRVQKLPERLRGNIPASCNGNVRMPWAQIRLQPGSERGFLDAFVDLKQMRVRLADADAKASIYATLEAKFEFLYDQLAVTNTRHLVEEFVSPAKIEKPKPAALGA